MDAPLPSSRCRAFRLLKATAGSGGRIFAGVFVGYALLLVIAQRWMIYHPRPYGAAYATQSPAALVDLDYTTPEGRQRAFYLPPQDPTLPQPARVVLLFSGNGALAKDWLGFIQDAPRKSDGYLLIDYPGYGDCQGAASPESIETSVEGALTALEQHLRIAPGALDGRYDVIAHSLGCGAALNFAVRHPVGKLILLSPFTSLQAMAKRVAGWPLCYLLRGNFDNTARMRELAAQPHPPQVYIFHGEKDRVIPAHMGRELSQVAPITTFHLIPDADHDGIATDAQESIYEALDTGRY